MELRSVVPAAIALVIGGAFAFWWQSKDVTPVAPPVQVPTTSGETVTGEGGGNSTERPWRAEPVREATIDTFERLRARIESPDPVPVRSSIKAFVLEILVQPGSIVRKGQLLFRLNSKSHEEALEAARTAKNTARVKEIEESLEIRAPADGVVHEVNVLKGDRPPPGVEGAPPRPMLVLFDWRKLRFHATAPKDLASVMGEGTRVRVQSPDGLVSEGIIDRRGEPDAEGAVPIVARPVQPPETTPNIKGEAVVLVPTGERRILVVPATAVELKSGRHVVQKVTITGTRVPTSIIIGPPVGNGMVEVKSGLGLNQSIAVPKR